LIALTVIRIRLQGVISVENYQQSINAQHVILRDQIKMADKLTLAGVTVKVMPESVEVDFDQLKKKVEESVLEVYGKLYGKDAEIRYEEKPLAFGLKELEVTFIIDESQGSDAISEKLGQLEEVASARVINFVRLT
jgi:translation elongation factor aEF-1 beta